MGTNPITLWTGTEVHTDNPDDLAAIDTYFRDEYLEALAAGNPDLARGVRYDLLAPDRHKGFGARFLTAFELASEEAAGRCADRQDLLSVPSAPPVWQAGVTTGWSLMYRYVTETGPALVRPYAIYMVGVDPPPDIDAAGLDEFNEFYTSVHVPEVLKRRRGLRATRYELFRELLQPAEGYPRFMATYEVDEKATANTRHIGGGYSRGPDVWKRHKTPWRLWYRLLPEGGSA
jgi:hypothetical protein